MDPEIGKSVDAKGIKTNYLEEGAGAPVVLIHGSGPGVTAYANWRLVLPKLAPKYRVVAPDIVGFGYTERPRDATYTLDYWIDHLLGFLDGVGIEKASFVGNSFGGALVLALAARHPDRVDRFVLMGAAGTRFTLTSALDTVWGYEPSEARTAEMLNYFVYDRSILTPELAASRYKASIRPGYQESYAALFPAPRQRHIERLSTPDDLVRQIPHRALIIHGRDDQVIPLETSLRLHSLIERSQMHVFGQCGHWVQVEKNASFCTLVGAFLAGDMD